MFTTLSRIIKYGIQGFWRNGWLSTATIAIMVIVLIVFEALIFLDVFTQTSLTIIQDKIDISVYFKSETPEDTILDIKRSLESLSEVKRVDYISRAQALESFRSRHSDNPTVNEALTELQENPLSASLNIKAHNPNEYAVIADKIKGNNFSQWFRNVTYAQNALVIERLSKIIDTADKGGLIIITFLTLIAILVAFNTIRLAIYSNRDEINIMRLVGASNALIRGPYIVEGVIFGILAAIISLVVATPITYFISPYLKVFIPELNLWSYFLSNILILLGYQLLFGIVLGIISSSIAIRKYLRV